MKHHLKILLIVTMLLPMIHDLQSVAEPSCAVVAKFENEDGTTGAHWSYDTMRNAVEGLGAKMCDEPFFNGWALWVVMNMLYSDHAKSVDEFVPKDKQVKFYYSQAVEKLTDKDRAHFIRKYFDIPK